MSALAFPTVAPGFAASLRGAVTFLNSPWGFLFMLALFAASLVILGLFTSVITIAWRELKLHFRSAPSYLVLAMFLVYQGLVFFMLVTVLNRPDVTHAPPMRWFFGGVIWFYPIFAVVVAMLSQGVLTDEQRSRSIETLMTAPVRESEVVLGKFLGTLGFYVFMWLWTLPYLAILKSAMKGGSIAPGPVLSGYAGTLLIGALGLAFGVFCSSLTRNTLMSIMLVIFGLLMAFIVQLMSWFGVLKPAAGLGEKSPKILGLVDATWFERLLDQIQIITFTDNFSQGIVDSRHLIFLLSTTAFFLFAATRILQIRKWR